MKLIAAEKIRTQPRRKHGAVPARTDQEMQPARGQMRIGIEKGHSLLYPVYLEIISELVAFHSEECWYQACACCNSAFASGVQKTGSVMTF